jgi:hypothetical protein
MKKIITGRDGSRASEILDYVNLHSTVDFDLLSLQEACTILDVDLLLLIDSPALSCIHQTRKLINSSTRDTVEQDDFYIRLLTECSFASIIKDDGSLDNLKVKVKKYLNSNQLYKKRD